jgi:hypothetical protein
MPKDLMAQIKKELDLIHFHADNHISLSAVDSTYIRLWTLTSTYVVLTPDELQSIGQSFINLAALLTIEGEDDA